MRQMLQLYVPKEDSVLREQGAALRGTNGQRRVEPEQVQPQIDVQQGADWTPDFGLATRGKLVNYGETNNQLVLYLSTKKLSEKTKLEDFYVQRLRGLPPSLVKNLTNDSNQPLVFPEFWYFRNNHTRD